MLENLETIVNELNELNARGRYDEVLSELNKYTPSEKNESNLFVVQGNAQYGLGRFTDAVESYATAISLDPLDIGARINYGASLFEIGQYVDGLNACQAAIALDEGNGFAYINAAHCLAALGHTDHAVYMLEQAFNTDPSDPDVGERAADLLAGMGEYELARDVYMKVAALPDAPADIHQSIAAFFQNAKSNGIDRHVILKDVDEWRKAFTTNPEVFRLAQDLS